MEKHSESFLAVVALFFGVAVVTGAAHAGQAGHDLLPAEIESWQLQGPYAADLAAEGPRVIVVALQPESGKPAPGEQQAGNDDC